MGSWVAVVVVAVVAVVVVAAGAAIVAAARRTRATTDAGSRDRTALRSDPAPMTDLESALAQVTDRDGRPIRERIDAESVHVDPLRDPDDTGPLLRRALDSVAHHEPEPAPDPEPRTDPA